MSAVAGRTIEERVEEFEADGGDPLDTGWIVRLDPLGPDGMPLIPGRTVLDLNSGPIRVGTIDWGQAAINATLAQEGIYGQPPIDFDLPDRTITIGLLLGADDGAGGVSEEEARSWLQQKVGRIQFEQGVLMRQRLNGPAMYANIHQAALTLPDVYGETGGIEPDVSLVLTCAPDFYGDERALPALNGTEHMNSVLTTTANLVPNPSFEHDTTGSTPAGWAISTGATLTTHAVQTGWAQNGSKSFRVTVTNSTGTTRSPEIETSAINITAGATYYVEATVNVLEQADGVTLAVLWYDSGANLIETVPVSGPYAGDGVMTLSGSLTAPANAVQAIVGIIGSVEDGQTWDLRIDSALLVEGTNGSYVDGDTTGYSWVGTAGNSATKGPAVIEGDYPAQCRIVVTDTSGQRHLAALWGFRSRYYDSASTAGLFYGASQLTPLDSATYVSSQFAIEHPGIAPGAWTPICSTNLSGGTVQLSHVGSYNVWARVSGAPVQLRFLYGVGDVSHRVTNPVCNGVQSDTEWVVNLGPINLPRTPVGNQAWTGVIQALYPSSQQVNVYGIYLQPLDDAAGYVVATPRSEAFGINTYAVPGAASTAGSGTGSRAWQNVASDGSTLQAQDGNAAFSGTSASSGTTDWLLATNFGFNIPADATIRGIDVKLLKWATAPGTGYAVDSNVALIQGGSIAGTNMADTSTPWPSRPAFKHYGGDGAGWGLTWTPAGINSSAFGVAIAASLEAETTVYVDAITVTIYYTQNETAFEQATDAVLYENQTMELRTEGMWRQAYASSVYGPIAMPVGDLPRLPVSGMEGRPVELFLKPCRGRVNDDPSSFFDVGNDTFTAQVYYRPCWLSRP